MSAAGEIRIRQAMPEDAEVVSSVLKEAALWLEEAGMLLWTQDELEVGRIVGDVRAGLFFIAEYSGDAAGTLKFQLDDPVVWPEAREQDACYVHRLAVRRRYAGAGLSPVMLRWAVERTRSLGRRYLRLDCIAARPKLRAVYERFGFRYHSDKPVGPKVLARYGYDVTTSR